jgi:putative transposase
MIDPASRELSIREQCALLGLNRASYYYVPEPVSDETLTLMRLLDQQYTATPFYGVKKMTQCLRAHGYTVGKDRVRTLLRKMGLEALYPRRSFSQGGPEHKVYPYLLRDVSITQPNQVWSADITYIRLQQGFAYLVAILDWFSRYVLSWVLSHTLESDFCVQALQRALGYGAPQIFNTDQGRQFTSASFTEVLLGKKIAISMDSRGRVFDNIFVERLWRTVKYEDIYLKGYETLSQAEQGLSAYFQFYNTERYHQALRYQTPWRVYRNPAGNLDEIRLATPSSSNSI